jgi:hypothetical protein
MFSKQIIISEVTIAARENKNVISIQFIKSFILLSFFCPPSPYQLFLAHSSPDTSIRPNARPSAIDERKMLIKLMKLI